jgi:hypothetical protein
LLTVAFAARFVDVNHLSILDLATDLLGLAATGARSALGRVPRGRAREFQSVQLLEAISDLPVGKAVIVPRNC